MLEVDCMGVGKGVQEEEFITSLGLAVLMVNFVSNIGQEKLSSETGLADVEEDLAGNWLQGEQEVVGTGLMLLLPSIITDRDESGVNILLWVLDEEVLLLEEKVGLVLVVLCSECMEVVTLDLSLETAKMELGING